MKVTCLILRLTEINLDVFVPKSSLLSVKLIPARIVRGEYYAKSHIYSYSPQEKTKQTLDLVLVKYSG